MTKFFVLVPLLAGALSVSAQAQEASVAVGFGDLDLTTTSALARQLDVWVRGVDTASAPLIGVSRVTFMDLARPSPVAASGTGARPRLVKDVE